MKIFALVPLADFNGTASGRHLALQRQYMEYKARFYHLPLSAIHAEAERSGYAANWSLSSSIRISPRGGQLTVVSMSWKAWR